MVDIVDDLLRVDKPDEVLDDGHDILVGQYAYLGIDVETELLIDTIAAYFTEVIALVGEEEVREDFTSVGLIGRVCITQLTIDIVEGIVLGVTGVLLQSVEDQREVKRILGLLLVEEDRLIARLEDQVDVVFSDLCLTLYEDGDTLHGDDFTRILIAEVIDISLGDAASKAATDVLLKVSARDLHLFGEIEEIEDLLIRLKANSTQQGRHRELLLTVDVGIHDIVDVRSELDPRALERNDTCRVELRAVGVRARAKEHPGRTVELRDDDSLSPINDKRTRLRHVRDVAQEDILHYGAEVLVVGVGTRQLQLRLEGDAIGQTSAQAFLDSVLRRIDIVIEKFENEVITRISDREVLIEDSI